MMPPTGKASNFFVIGLPRSRTAWLANFLTYGDHFCFHEGLNGCHSISEYKQKIAGCGDSGTGLMMFDMNTLFPDSPVVIIESNPGRSIDFMLKTYGAYEPSLIYELWQKLDKIEGLRIRFEDINDRLEEIWTHLIGDGFDKRRADMLIKLNIQMVDPTDFDRDALNALFGGAS